MRSLIPFALAIMLVSCAHEPGADRRAVEPPPLQGKVIDYGLYEVVRTGPLVTNPATSTGKAHSSSIIKILERTNRIPLEKGNYFAFKSRIEPLPDNHWITLRKVVTHPKMVLPDGSISTGYELRERKRVSNGVAFATAGYSLDEDFEMVAGDWVFQYWFQGQLLIEQRFTSHWPEEQD